VFSTRSGYNVWEKYVWKWEPLLVTVLMQFYVGSRKEKPQVTESSRLLPGGEDDLLSTLRS
jgi:hypothetical protein